MTVSIWLQPYRNWVKWQDKQTWARSKNTDGQMANRWEVT